MRQFRIFLILLIFIPGAALSQAPLAPSTYIVSTLPAAGLNRAKVVVVSDGAFAGDCTTGGGSALAFCRSNGTSWVAIGDGTASGGASVISFNGRTGSVLPVTNDYTWAQINKSTSSIADITTRSAGDLSSGTLPDARLSANVPLLNAANLFIAGQSVKIGDAVTNTFTDLVTLYHNSSGTAAANFGESILFNLNSSTTYDRNAARIAAVWTTATDASRASAVVVQTVTAAGALTEIARFGQPAPAPTDTLYLQSDRVLLPPYGILAGYGTGDPTTFSEGFIKFAKGADPVMRIDGGENNELALRADVMSLTSDDTLVLTAATSFTFTGPFVTVSGLLKAGSTPVTLTNAAGKIHGAALVGTDIATVGTITSGTWQGTVIGSTYGGTGISNAGTFTNASNTTITGGGTLALGGFTFTVPATGTAVLTSRTITEGAGLAGNTYDFSANRTLALGTPSTLSVSTSNSASGTTHTHAITSSSNPGAAVSLLATDASGYLTTVRHTVTDYLFVNNATANLFLKDTSTGFQSATTLVVTPQANNAFRSTSFTSGLVGWGINAAGSAEFDNVDIRGAIHSSIFTYNAINVTAGTQVITPSGAKLKSDVTVSASPTYGTTTFTVDAVDQDGITHAASQLFAVNDIIRLKDGVIGDTWFKVTAVSDQTTFWRYTASIQAGTANVTYRAGQGIPDYKQSGAGFIMLTADQTNAPYLQMATHAGTFSSADASGSLVITPQIREGNLNGAYGYSSDVYGFAAGQYGAASKSWIMVDQTSGIRIGNNATQLAQWDTSGNILVGRTGSSQSNVYITSGAVALRNNTTTRINLAADGSGYLANSLIAWDTGGNLSVTGNATIGGWTIGTTRISSTHVFIDNAGEYLSLGATPPTSYGSNVGVFLEGANSGRLSLYKDANNYLQWDSSKLLIKAANFTLDSSGNLTATSATLSGAITATSGSLTGTLTMSGSGSAIAIGSTPPSSASSGTGIWIDRTGIYGLASSAVQFKLDAATGKISTASFSDSFSYSTQLVASADGVVLDGSIGIGVTGGHGGDVVTGFYSPRVRLRGGFTGLSPLIGQYAVVDLKEELRGASGASAGNDTTSAWVLSNTVTKGGGTSFTGSPVSADMFSVDLAGNGVFAGTIKAGSSVIALTNSTGNILGAALVGTDITTLGTVTTGTWSATAIGVTKGGTGLTSTTANQLLYSSATSTIAGLATANNAVLVTSSGGVPSLAAPGSSLSVSTSSLNTIQDIRTSASPTFAGLTLTSILTANSSGMQIGRVSSAVLANGANNNVALPANATFVTFTDNGGAVNAAYSVSGFANAVDGRIVIVNFNIAQTLTLKHDDSASSVGQRITMPGQADHTFAANKLVRCIFIYDQSVGGGVGYWVLFSAIDATNF